jgi:hypothetical protein
MSTNLSDVSSAGISSPPPSAPVDSTDAATSSVAGQESGSGTSSQVVGDVNAGASVQDNSGQTIQQEVSTLPPSDEDIFKDIPSIDELQKQAEQKVPYSEALLRTRTAYEALKPRFSELEPLAAFKDVVGQTTPEQLQAKLDIVDGFFSPVLDESGKQVYDNGLPLMTSKPGLEKLAAESPETVFQILNDALPLPIGENGATVKDCLVDYFCREYNLNPQNLRSGQYGEWEKTGAPVAQSTVDHSSIPEKFKAAFGQLPVAKQRDLAALMASEDAEQREIAEYDLNQAQERYERGQAEARGREQAAREAQVKIEQSTQQAVMGKFETGFNQFLQHLSTWKPTSDDAVNSIYHLEVANTLVNLLDNQMGFANQMLFEKLGMQADAEIPQLNQTFQQQLGLVELYKSRGEGYKASEAQRSADASYMKLVAKLNGVAGKLIEHKTKVAESLEAASQAGQQGRTHVTGQPGAFALQGNGKRDLSKWYD